MIPWYQDDLVSVYLGECMAVMAAMADCSVDSVVTDPPYGLEFMGQSWDAPWAESGINADAGFKGGGVSATKAAPSFTGSTNSNCEKCGGKQRGRRDGTAIVAVCVCDAPSFPNVRAVEMRAFQQWCEAWATECLRVLKPGGYLLAFGGSRTWHRLAAAVEDSGFEIRDSIAWLYGSGFPKSLNVSKAIASVSPPLHVLSEDEARFCQWMQKSSGLTKSDCKRLFTSDRFLTGTVEVINTATKGNPRIGRRAMVPTWTAWQAALDELPPIPDWVSKLVKSPPKPPMQTPSEWKAGNGNGTEGDGQWAGWGTALKPAFEPIVVGRKPLVGTVAANVLTHGTGALNIDACRTAGEAVRRTRNTALGVMNDDGWQAKPATFESHAAGRWPTNVVLDESQAEALDEQTGVLTSGSGNFKRTSSADTGGNKGPAFGAESRVAGSEMISYGDSGGASRFFPTFRYEAKAPQSERPKDDDGTGHPTVKPLDLMRWLVRLVTPPGGTVLEPFAGSGTTVEACMLEGFKCVAVERDPKYKPLIKKRISKPIQSAMFSGDW